MDVDKNIDINDVSIITFVNSNIVANQGVSNHSFLIVMLPFFTEEH